MTQGSAAMSATAVDFEKFRLRPFIERLAELGEVETHEEPVPLAGLSALVEASPKATLFKRVGPERYEMVAAVSGSRRRIAAAFGVDESEVVKEFARRMANPQPVVEVPTGSAPVQEVVRTGTDIDLAKLPFHLQHEFDGCTYISSAIDYTVDPATGKNNVGCRRLMLRDRQTMRSNLSQPSDLKRIYLAAVARGEKLPVSFAVGSHPLDFLAAGLRIPADEFGLVGTLRGERVPMAKGITNGVPAPADAEMVIEGYFDELGYREKEGPYGEFWGFYGPVHMDPVFHVTAITMRKDVLYQTVLHSGRRLARTDSANLGAVTTEAAVWRALSGAGIVPAAVYCVINAAARSHVRVALKRGTPGQARLAISALFAMPFVKHVTIVDDDVDVRADDMVEWAMSTRFRADRDVVVADGFNGFYMDPTADTRNSIAKIGFDATAPYGGPENIEAWRPQAAQMTKNPPRYQTVRQALEESGPLYFRQIMEAVGSDDGREVALELDQIAKGGGLDRTENGQWTLKPPR
jgi:UbiD family decarboxylase